ncbi:MAG: hypothetical protein S4CHLAM6_11230 [Chlamydiae bacterium]|nr:hypothetical protein [Chlamydiota bacterium]
MSSPSSLSDTPSSCDSSEIAAALKEALQSYDGSSSIKLEDKDSIREWIKSLYQEKNPLTISKIYKKNATALVGGKEHTTHALTAITFKHALTVQQVCKIALSFREEPDILRDYEISFLTPDEQPPEGSFARQTSRVRDSFLEQSFVCVGMEKAKKDPVDTPDEKELVRNFKEGVTKVLFTRRV